MNELLFLITIIICILGIFSFYKYLGHDGLYLWIIIATIFSFIASFRTMPLYSFNVNCAFPILTSIYICIYILIEKYTKKEINKVISTTLFTSLIVVFGIYLSSIYQPSIYNNVSIYLSKLIKNNLINLFTFPIMIATSQYFTIKIYKYIKEYYNNTFVKNCLTTIAISVIDTIFYLMIINVGNTQIGNIVYIALATYAFKLMTTILYLPFMYYIERTKKVKK